MAILDADKEGFLRSETRLIQTIGRAARNVDGNVVLYADHITGSMERAIAETDRRREKQVAYNMANGITPQSIHKNIGDIMATSMSATMCWSTPGRVSAAEGAPLVGHNMEAVIADMEKRMRDAAANLEFEKAARLRDEIKRLKRGRAGHRRRSVGAAAGGRGAGRQGGQGQWQRTPAPRPDVTPA